MMVDRALFQKLLSFDSTSGRERAVAEWLFETLEAPKKEAFEVGDEVYEQFQDAGFPMAQIARRYAKWHIDLPACNRLLLAETGVHRIEMSGICTYQQSGDYFSARKLGVDSGRILTGVVLR